MGCWREIAVTVLLGSGCDGSEPAACADPGYSIDLSDLYDIALLEDGYVLDRPTAVVGYGFDNTERFRIDGIVTAFATVSDGRLLVARREGDTHILAAYTSSGELLGELGRLDLSAWPGAGGSVVLDDGSLILHGGTSESWWTGRISPDGRATVQDSAEQRLHTAAGTGGTAFVIDSTRYPTLGMYEHVRVSRLAAGGSLAWTRTVFDRKDDTTEIEVPASVTVAGARVLVVTSLGREFRVRAFDGSDGELLWLRDELLGINAPGLAIARDDATIVWVDAQADPMARLRQLDNKGKTLCSTEFSREGGGGVSDLAILGDELFVVTVDHLTRIRLGDPSAEP